MREQKDKEQQQCILVFQQRRIPFKYLTFHEVFKNSNTCYLWNIWKVQEGIKKYKKEKIIKITAEINEIETKKIENINETKSCFFGKIN